MENFFQNEQIEKINEFIKRAEKQKEEMRELIYVNRKREETIEKQSEKTKVIEQINTELNY